MTSGSLSTIARLLNLEELFLTRTIIQGEEWNMGEEHSFVNLKYLNLDGVTLAKWECPQLEVSALEIKQSVEDMTGEDKLQILGSNNIPLSKTEVSFILSLSISRTLPCFRELFRHAQFTPPSWRAAAMPRTVEPLSPSNIGLVSLMKRSLLSRATQLEMKQLLLRYTSWKLSP
ncbi:hypothetical protein CQW23_13552 [Capsicum baccatum]|uniref:Uncharacterized protein n=1 Tax=Capsicum baccatum TaxID=33114 RepID=A0A2G2WGN6_CAPBA|nr:hypothetical protein CQW23_13552 [Capsicum baccatum]